MRRIMWLSVNRLSVDQGHKKKRVDQDWEIQDHVKFSRKKKKRLTYSFIFSSTPVPKYYSFLYPADVDASSSETSLPASQRRL